MPKINLPTNTQDTLPNVNNKVGEYNQYVALCLKTTRSNTGQVVFLSTTSGITYNTSDYPGETNIYNQGETGMMNLLFKLYSGANGFIVSAEDINSLVDEINGIKTDYQPKNLKFHNISLTSGDFVSDATYSDYPYRATIPLVNVGSDDFASVIFDLVNLEWNILCQECRTWGTADDPADGGVYIYSSDVPFDSIVIPLIIIDKGGL